MDGIDVGGGCVYEPYCRGGKNVGGGGG